MCRKWTEEEVEYLKANFGKKPHKEIGEALGRSAKAIADKSRKLDLSRDASWTEEEIAFLKDNAQDKSHKEIANILGRSEGAVRNKCWRLGLVDLHWWSKDEIEILKEYYERAGENGPVGIVELEEILGRRRSGICRKAQELGFDTHYGRERTEEFKQQCSIRSKKYLATHEHPRGMLGKTLPIEARIKISESSQRMWADPNSYVNSEEYRQKLSDRMMTPPYRFTPGAEMYSKAKGGKREDIGIYVRSAWEANYARYLEFLKQNDQIKAWEYEPETFDFEPIKRGTRSYTPDFKVTNSDGSIEYHEVKGWMDAKSKTQLKRMAKYYPDITIVIIGEEEYYAIRAECKNLIPNWE